MVEPIDILPEAPVEVPGVAPVEESPTAIVELTTENVKISPRKRGRPKIPEEAKTYNARRKTKCPGCQTSMTEHQFRYRHVCSAEPVESPIQQQSVRMKPPPRGGQSVPSDNAVDQSWKPPTPRDLEPAHIDGLIFEYLKERRQNQQQAKRNRYSMFVSSFA